VDTFPALNTYLPEASKTYRDIFVVVQGNEHRNAATTDHTMTISVGSTTVTTGNYEGALASDRWFRYVFNILAAGFAGQASSQNFQLSATVARCNHLQAYAVVTYEYNESTSTSIMNSVMLPMRVKSPMGGTTSSDYQRASRYLDIEEPATIATSRVAFYAHWTQAAAISGLNMRVGTGAFVAYTDTASVLCGGNGAMVRNDAAFTLARGRNTLNLDVYRTDTADYGWSISGFWLVNYTSGKAAAGSGAHNHSVLWGLQANGTAAGADNYTIAATAPNIPEAEYYVNSLGTRLIALPSGATQPAGLVVAAERLAAEGGVAWDEAYRDMLQTDAELGVYVAYSQVQDSFQRWPNDAQSGRMPLETNRRWRAFLPASGGAAPGWIGLSMMLTYHSILGTVAGNVTNSAGGTVNLNLHDSASGEVLKTGSRTGNGAYSIAFFGDTRSVYVTARESGTLLGRSDTGTPTLA
jgi:hypothetical protein